MRNVVFILLCWYSIASNAQTKSIVGKWKTEDQTVVYISPISERSFQIKQISTLKELEKEANGKVIGHMTVVSSTEWKGAVFDVKENKTYQAKFVLQKDLKLAVSVKWGLLRFTDKWTKID